MSVLDEIIAEQEQAAWPALFPAHLSATQLAMAEACPEQWRRRYLLGLKERPAGALVWGGADHEAQAVNFTQKIQTGLDLPAADVEEAFADAFDRRSSAEDVDWGDDKPGELKDAGVRLARLYHEQVSPTVQPTAVEQPFELRIPGVPVPVVGYIDVLTDTTGIERKTARAKAAAVKPRWRLQGLLYQLHERTPIEWHVSVKTRTPAVYTPQELPGLRLDPGVLDTTRRYVQSRVAALLAMYDRFGPDEPWPGAITDDWRCRYCGWGPNGTGACAWWQQ